MPGADDVLDLSVVANPVAPDVRPLLRELVLVDDRDRATAVLALAMGVEVERLVLTEGPPSLTTGVDPGPVLDDTWAAVSDGRWTTAAPGTVAWHTGSLDLLWKLDGIGLHWVLAPSAAAAAGVQGVTERPALVALSLVEPLTGLTDPRRWSAIVTSLRSDLVMLLQAYGHQVETPRAPYVVVPDGVSLVRVLATQGVRTTTIPQPGGEGAARITVPDGTGLLRLAEALHAACPSAAPPGEDGGP